MGAFARPVPLERAPVAAPVLIGPEGEGDAAAREGLLDAVMGPIRFQRSSERLREGRLPAIALVARREGEIVGTVRLWHARACGLSDALLLGPLAVASHEEGRGIGSDLMTRAIGMARDTGFRAILLVGDEAYYHRFGFRARHAQRLAMPGPFERHRMLGLPLEPGALDRAHGVLRPPALRPGLDARHAARAA